MITKKNFEKADIKKNNILKRNSDIVSFIKPSITKDTKRRCTDIPKLNDLNQLENEKSKKKYKAKDKN